MRLLPHTEIDDPDKKIRNITGHLSIIEMNDGCQVEINICDGRFSFVREYPIEHMKSCLKLMVLGFGLEYKE